MLSRLNGNLWTWREVHKLKHFNTEYVGLRKWTPQRHWFMYLIFTTNTNVNQVKT